MTFLRSTGQGVPEAYKRKDVTVYRPLKCSEDIIGTWSEYAQLHYLQEIGNGHYHAGYLPCSAKRC